MTVEKAIEVAEKTKRKIVWLGFEEKESLASMLSIPSNLIEAICLSRLLDLSQSELLKYQNAILLGYTTNSTNIAAKVLQQEAQLNCTVVAGGLVNNVPKGKSFARRIIPLEQRHVKLTPLTSRHIRINAPYN